MEFLKSNLTWTFAGLLLGGSVLYWVNQAKEPEALILEVEASSSNDQYDMVGDALVDPEHFAVQEDASLEASIEETDAVVEVAITVDEAPLAAKWERQSAPSMSDVKLSPSFERSLAASASLRTDEFIGRDSQMNREVVTELRAIREARQAAK